MEQREIPVGVLLTGVEAFSLEDTLDCGQCFVFSRLPDGGLRVRRADMRPCCVSKGIG